MWKSKTHDHKKLTLKYEIPLGHRESSPSVVTTTMKIQKLNKGSSQHNFDLVSQSYLIYDDDSSIENAYIHRFGFS
jgi:hypothetical protein